MDTNTPLSELFNHDLAGWQLRNGYYLRIKHSGMGTFPAIQVDDNQPVICLSREDLRAVYEQLTSQRSEVVTLPLLLSPQGDMAYRLDGIDFPDTKPLHVTTREEIDQLDSSFRWAVGILTFDRVGYPFPAS